ncbi:MAG: hypothetical protein K2I77_06365, partial [Anaeroplasmataceae bacterium]|nr:hypothetical protein [Anaeroplasmataceae bacterium]
MRLDCYLVEKHFFDTRNKAQIAIKEEAVSVDGKIINKANFEVCDDAVIEIIKQTNIYVSRG